MRAEKWVWKGNERGAARRAPGKTMAGEVVADGAAARRTGMGGGGGGGRQSNGERERGAGGGETVFHCMEACLEVEAD